MALVAALWVLLVLSLVLTTVQALLAVRFLRGRRPLGLDGRTFPPADSTPAPRTLVSILKPLSGLDERLEENLEHFVALSGISWELLLSVADPSDPAVAVARRVLARHPGAPVRLVVGGVPPGVIRNPKVERLVAAARHARGEILFISDANALLTSEDVARTVALFSEPGVGCVSNVFVGDAEESLGAHLESLYLLTFVLPGATLAAAAGIPCVVGKSMALSRAAHDAIGGFAAVGDVLAEDQALGLHVREAGYDVVLSPVLARNVLGKRGVRQALSRQVRWGQIRYAFSKATYAGEVLLNPLGLALIGVFAAGCLAPRLLGTALALAGISALLRILQAALLGRATGTRPSLALVPVKDLLQIAAHLAPFVARDVTWQGKRSRLGKGTLLLPAVTGGGAWPPTPARGGVPRRRARTRAAA